MTRPQPPRASVVMSVYGDLRFLDEAVESILASTYQEFEFIIVDDGTGEAAVLALAARDPRIRVLVNERNRGGAQAGNRGIAAARSDIIVRFDADDVAEPERIGSLVAALDAEPDLGLVGSDVTLISEDGAMQSVARMPRTDVDIRFRVLFHNPFYHPTVAFRRRCFAAAGPYKEDEAVSYDHYLWFAMLDRFRARNLPEPLVRYRLNSRGLTAAHGSSNPRARTHPIREELWRRIGLPYRLYDEPLATGVNAFLRGTDLEPASRAPAYEVVLDVLERFVAHELSRRTPRGALTDLAGLVEAIAQRIEREPPDGAREHRRAVERCATLRRFVRDRSNA